jgi:small subunit ribosomal protein S13
MPSILGIDIPDNKPILYALPYIYGIGLTRAREIVKKADIDPAKRSKQLSHDELSKITAVLQEGYIFEGELRRETAQNIRRLVNINCYRGTRHKKNLPARGQRTHTNARTRKGPRRTVGAVRGKEARAEARKEPRAG